MEVFAREIRYYFLRDLTYLIGGGTITISFLYCFDRFSNDSASTELLFFGAGLSYVAGVIVHNAASMFHLITTSADTRPNRVVAAFYHLHTQRRWNCLERFGEPEYRSTQRKIYDSGSEWAISQLNRIETLKHIGNIMAPSMLTAFAFLAFQAVESRDSFDIALAAIALVMGLLALPLGWVKAAQQAEYVYRLKDENLPLRQQV